MASDYELWLAARSIRESESGAHAQALGWPPGSLGDVWFSPRVGEYPTGRGQERQPVGWECPRCHACWGPHVHRCGNCGPEPASVSGSQPHDCDVSDCP